MGVITDYVLLDILVAIFATTLVCYINFKLRSRKYWAKRNIPYEEPYFILGNMPEANITKNFAQITDELYAKHKEKKILGIWSYVKPALLIFDLEILKHVMVKDFSHFHDRGLTINEELEPLTAHLFNISGQKWRNLRVKLTPTFTSGKMKMMYEAMWDCGQKLQDYLKNKTGQTLETKELLASFTTEVIATCAFGVNAQALGNPDSDFRKYGRKIISPPFWNIIGGILMFVAPKLAIFLNLRTFPKDATDFFTTAVQDVMEYRDKGKIKKKDFVDLLLQLKNQGYIEDADTKYSDNQASPEKFTEKEAAAQAFVFFLAGFETSSTALTFACYELAKNPDIQNLLQAEIDEALKKEDGKISYSTLQDMQYLDQVILETLRMYPPVPSTFRECTKRYEVPGTSFVIEKGDFLLVPISGIQNDPDYFPDPQKFDPTRFSKENSANRDSFLNLAFGTGPRNCIGSRFGLQQFKIGLISLLAKYKLEVADNTPIPIKFDVTSFVPTAVGGMHLRIESRN